MVIYPLDDSSLVRDQSGRTVRRVIGAPLADAVPGDEDGPGFSRTRAPARAHGAPILAYVVEIHPSANGPTVAIASPETDAETEPEGARLYPMTVLHPTDFSRHSAAAFHIACCLAQENGGRVVALHVGPPPPTATIGNGSDSPAHTPNDDRAMLWRALLNLEAPFSDVRVERWLEAGDPATTILRAAQETSADLIVMGIRGETARPRPRIGHVTEFMVRKATCPVIALSAPVRHAGRAPTVRRNENQRDLEAYWTDLGGEG